ncbi:hypothetical protein GUA87_15405 [Sneathiella sp. P13V-1]|uniref:hypothetical protein n=1 Tax=Sneathiella sp. P13V-1 TaxID=2697366 RepID=UPI00187B3061|nr:hypothetical protein [Sneathiella sp. P13V-1]MBE7638245.1 hypothetical protein [Sneathiella sp. P13V-1]
MSVFPQTVRRPATETAIYLLMPVHKGQLRNPAPQLLRGDPELVTSLIDGCEYKNPRTFGVLSWHPDDVVTAEQEQEVMDAFMEAAFPGIPDELRPPVLFVRHTHTENGHHEIHFLLPRMLMSEKARYYDIKPPVNTGQGHTLNKRWDAFCDYFDMKHGWQNPREYHSRQFVQLPDCLLKDVTIHDLNVDEFRLHLSAFVDQGVRTMNLTSRDEVIEYMKDLNIDIARINKQTVSVFVPGTKMRARLKGEAMQEGFAGFFDKEVDQNQIAEFEKNNPKSVEEAEARYLSMLEKTAVQNRERYRKVLAEEAERQRLLVDPPSNIWDLADQFQDALVEERLPVPNNDNFIDLFTIEADENEKQTELPDRDPTAADGKHPADSAGRTQAFEMEFEYTNQRSRGFSQQIEDVLRLRKRRSQFFKRVTESFGRANRELQSGQHAYRRLCHSMGKACVCLSDVIGKRERQYDAIERFAGNLQQKIIRAGTKIRRFGNFAAKFTSYSSLIDEPIKERVRALKLKRSEAKRKADKRRRDMGMER